MRDIVKPEISAKRPARFGFLSNILGRKSAKSRAKTFTRTSFRFRDYIWISLLWFGISYLWSGVNAVILPKLNERFVDGNYKGTTLGIITALGMVVAIVVQPAAGALSDICSSSWGRRRPFILVGGVAVIFALILMTAMVVFFGSWWMLLVCYLFLQLADNIAQGAYQGVIPDCVPDGRRGRASGAMGISQILGNTVGLVIATQFVTEGKFDIALMIIIFVFAVTLVPTLLFIREEPLEKRTVRTNRLQVVLGVLRELKHHPDFMKFIVSRLFVLTSLATVTTFGLYYLQDVLKLTEKSLADSYILLGAIIVACSVASIVPAVWLSERIGRKKVVIGSCVVGAIGMVLLATADSLTSVVIYGSLIGLATGSFNSLDWALATDLLPPGAAGRFMGVSNLAGAGSQALAALLGGTIRDGGNAFGSTFLNLPQLGYTSVFLMGAFYFLFGIYFLNRIHDPQVK